MIKGIRHVALLSVIICSGAVAKDDVVCDTILQSKENSLFITDVEVKGPRGSLRFPAIIDTGASSTLIPASIMEGIGYSSQGKRKISTTGGKNSFDKGTVSSLSFLGIIFKNVVVYVDKPKSRILCGSIPGCDNLYDETGIIGMSELSQTSFEYIDGVMIICSNGKQ